MHVEGISRGSTFDWLHYPEPPAELLERFGEASPHEADWNLLEPEFSPPP